jgi:hypothetical protein
MDQTVSELKLEARKYYRAKKPRRIVDGGYNDRYVVWISNDGRSIQYDSPTIGIGRSYPIIPIEKFQVWVGREITHEDYMDTS